MRIFLRCNLLALLLCAMMTISACGQKGDLYLPEGQAQAVKVG